MDINSLYPGQYLRAADLQGQARTVTIKIIAPEEIAQGETKPVLQY